MTAPITSFQGEYRFLSNFWLRPVRYQGKWWRTSEHAFQAMKTADPVQQEFVRDQLTPGEAKRAGRKVVMRPNWDAIKDGVMYDILVAKFEDHTLRGPLLATGDAELIEGNTWGNTWGDTYWGVCKGEGQNKLGKLLMTVRSEIAQATTLQNVELAMSLTEEIVDLIQTLSVPRWEVAYGHVAADPNYNESEVRLLDIMASLRVAVDGLTDE